MVPHNGELRTTSSFACLAWTQVPHNVELWPTSSFACIAWTQVPQNGELTFWAVIIVPHNGELCTTSSFACIAWTQVLNNGEPHYHSQKSQTVYIETCLPIQFDFSGHDNGSSQWGTVTNFKGLSLYWLSYSQTKSDDKHRFTNYHLKLFVSDM